MFVFVMPLMFTCSMDMPVAHGILIGLCGVFLGVGASFVLRACVGVVCFVGDVVWFRRTCALAPAPACGFVAHTKVGPALDPTYPAKSNIRFGRHWTGNLAGKPKKCDAVGAFGKAGKAGKLYLSDHFNNFSSLFYINK